MEDTTNQVRAIPVNEDASVQAGKGRCGRSCCHGRCGRCSIPCGGSGRYGSPG